MEFPVDVALAELVPTLPVGPRWWYELKLDGHRTVLFRQEATVRLQARSGRDVTPWWMDLALAGKHLPPGVVLDGEAVVPIDGRVSFEAAQSRAASTPARARDLAERHPALLIVWDVLALPTGDVRARPYEQRRALMLDVVGALPRPSPIQAVSATDDVEVARVWYETLADAGVEGVVAKNGLSPYRAGRSSSWKKVRHAETTDAEVVGFTGSVTRPRALVVRLPPRARGDGPPRNLPTRTRQNCSPRTRGWIHRVDLPHQEPGLLPAHAGTAPATGTSRTPRPAAPRARGDGPDATVTDTRGPDCSPRTRGWAPARCCPGGPLLLLPAHAGTDPPGRRRTG